MVITVTWILWKERNNIIFNRAVKTLAETLDWVVDEIAAWFQAGFSCLQPAAQVLGRLPGRATITV